MNGFLEEFKNQFYSNKPENVDVFYISNISNFISRILYRLFEKINFKLKSGKKKNGEVLTALLYGPEFSLFLFPGLKNIELAPVVMDAWPMYFNRIRFAIGFYKISTIYFSSKEVVELFNRKKWVGRAIWFPEAIDHSKYQYYLLADKVYDVINFGRKWDQYHNLIKPALEANGKSYLYDKADGKMMFKTSRDLYKTMSKTRISICVPSGITHPNRTGGISTMTQRYLQSMACGCLIVGIAPAELIDLFGYNPVIEIDLNDGERQIVHILDNISGYQTLIDRNYKEVMSNHTFQKRWKEMQIEL